MDGARWSHLDRYGAGRAASAGLEEAAGGLSLSLWWRLALLCMPVDDAATAGKHGRLAARARGDEQRRMGAGHSRAATDALRKRRELADFLSRSRASESTFSDSDSDGHSPRREALVMLPSALDPRGRTIRRVEMHPPAVTPHRRKAQAAPRFEVSAGAFEYLKVLGVGGTGRVLLVRCRHDQQLYAMKVYPKQGVRASRLTRNVLSERDVLGGTDHPMLARLHWAFQTPASLFLVMDYCPGGELSMHLRRQGRFSEETVRFYGAEMLLAIEHLHRHGVIYRDLKPENIVLTADGHVKLVDFGLSKFGITDATSGATSACGSYEYIAPEIIRQQEYGTATDWWSFGAVLYELMTGLPPWYDENTSVMVKRILSTPLELPKHLSPQARDLLSVLLSRDPLKRPSSSEIRRHPFFSQVDWSAMDARVVRPPIQPCESVDAIASASNFSSEFTSQPIGDVESSAVDSASAIVDEFAGFDFAVPNSADAA